MLSLRPEWVDAQARRREHQRGGYERLLELAQPLPDADRLLLEQVYRQGQTFADLARLMGQREWTLRRRVARLVKRMRQPQYRFLLKRRDLLDKPVRRCAELAYFQAYSLRRIAQVTGQSLHQVRRCMHDFQVVSRLLR